MRMILAATAAGWMALAGAAPAGDDPVRTGLDVLAADRFALLKTHEAATTAPLVGLITNQSGLSRSGEHILDLMLESGVAVQAIFAPEHGLRGDIDRPFDTYIDEATSLTVHSLYGSNNQRRPDDADLEGLDYLVFDIQDIGVRFYTYIATMGICMEAAQDHGIDFVVLDRPNPIGGHWFDGPIQDPDLVGNFTAFRPMPIVHGMTVGEVARFYTETDDELAVDLTVVEMENWKRGTFFDETGLPWVDPSPNMRSVAEEILYPQVALTEYNRTVSVGRGTERPFEYLGAPWIDGDRLAEELRARDLSGIWVMRTTFMPRALDVTGRENYPYQFTETVCQGVRFVVTDRDAVRSVEPGLHILQVLQAVGGERYAEGGGLPANRRLVGSEAVIQALEAGEAPAAIAERWRQDPAFEAFAQARQRALLY
ncbi:MAG: DUF1343 domain-containing protein [Sumerlaeia bacterium]